MMSVGSSFAETVTLKSGDVIEDQILESNAEFIRIKRFGVVITYFKDEIASIVKAPGIDHKKLLKDFVGQVSRMDEQVSQYLDKHSEQINHLGNDDQKQKALPIVLEETRYIQEQIKLIEKIPTVEQGKALKKIMLEYYRSMLETQASALKFLADTPGAEDLIVKKTDQMVLLEQKFHAELTRLKSLI
jgi:hypothetical protein